MKTDKKDLFFFFFLRSKLKADSTAKKYKQDVGLDHRLYGLHSLRSGGAKFAKSISPNVVKTTWKVEVR